MVIGDRVSHRSLSARNSCSMEVNICRNSIRNLRRKLAIAASCLWKLDCFVRDNSLCFRASKWPKNSTLGERTMCSLCRADLFSQFFYAFATLRSRFLLQLTVAVLMAGISVATAQNSPQEAPAAAVHLQLVASGFSSPLDFESAHDGTGRFFI